MTIDTASIVETIRSVVGRPSDFVPLHEPEFRGNEWDYVKDCLDTTFVSSVGKYVDRFEQMLAEYVGVAKAVAVSNGTVALQISLKLAGVQAGDEVIIPALSFVASANAVIHAGGIPHFADSEEATLGLSPGKLRAHLADIAEMRNGICWNRLTGARIAAVVPMHTFGHPVDMQGLQALAAEYNLPIVEDAAESLGSQYQGRHMGSFGLISALSFNGNKIITTGGGGAILTNDVELAKAAKHLTTTAKVPHAWEFFHDEIGYNFRLPNLNAALGCAQMEDLATRVSEKRALAARYAGAFAGISGLRFFTEPPNANSNYWLNTLILDEENAAQRDELLALTNAAGLMTRPVWTLLHLLPMYLNMPRADLSCAQSLAQRIINIPSSAHLFASCAA